MIEEEESPYDKMTKRVAVMTRPELVQIITKDAKYFTILPNEKLRDLVETIETMKFFLP